MKDAVIIWMINEIGNLGGSERGNSGQNILMIVTIIDMGIMVLLMVIIPLLMIIMVLYVPNNTIYNGHNNPILMIIPFNTNY